MGILKKKKGDDSRARRKARLRMALLRTILPILVITALFLTLFTWRTHIFAATSDVASAQFLNLSWKAGFKVNDILVTGRARVETDTLRKALGVEIGTPIFSVDLAAAQKSIGALPDIKKVSVARRLPDRLIISLEERTPAALWQNNKKISVIDKDGFLLSVDAAAWKELPLLVGADAGIQASEILSLLEAEPGFVQKLEAVQRIGGRRWDLHLKNGITVKLPEENAGLALRRLMEAEERKNILGRAIASIDMRQPDKMVILTSGS